MTQPKIPSTDSIEELASFWDTHEVVDFSELEPVDEAVFVKSPTLQVPLAKEELAAVSKLAEEKGVSSGELIRTWIRQHLTSR